jgi:inner membrane protein
VFYLDPLTHGVIGLAISTFSGTPVGVMNPITLGCSIGAMAPDIDVVMKFIWDDKVYLKHHRGFSHTMPALLGLSGIITGVLYMMFPGSALMDIFLWTMIGALSHTMFDILNSYGARLIPFVKRKFKLNLLMLYDPVVTFLALVLIFKSQKSLMVYGTSVTIFIVYLFARLLMRKRAEKAIIKNFAHGYKIISLDVLPALMAFHKWNFVLSTNSHSIAGQVNILNKRIEIRKKLRREDKDLVKIFKGSNAGQYFTSLSPNYHVTKTSYEGGMILEGIDLRYFMKNNFMHHATVIIDENQNILESFIQPYKYDKRIPVVEHF